MCLSITILPTAAATPGMVTVDVCQPLTLALAAAASATCPSGTTNRYETTCPTDCTDLQTFSGETVILTADPSSGWDFGSWSGVSCTGGATANPCSFVVSTSTSVTATFVRQQQTLTVNVNPSGAGTVTDNLGKLNCSTSCSVNYDSGSSVTLNQTQNPGYQFTGWSGDCTGTGSCTVRLDSPRSVTANYAPVVPVVHSLTITVSGNGSVSYSPVGDGSGSCTSSCVIHFNAGTSVTLTATDGADKFDHWSGDCTGSQTTCAVTMGADKTVSATFTTGAITAPRFALTVGVTGNGKVTALGIDCKPTCQSDYSAGTSLTLNAVPDSGFNFQNWDGACAAFGTQPTCSLVMDNDKTVTATFTADPVIGDTPVCSAGVPPPCDSYQIPPQTRSLVVNVSGADGGKVTGGPVGLTAATALDTPPPIACGSSSYVCYGDYTPGQTVKLRATPDRGFKFTGWADACTGKKTCTLTVSELKRVTAGFAPKGNRKERKLTMKVPALKRVQWKASIGSGRLLVKGSINGPATLFLDLRGLHTGKLLRHPRKLVVKRAGPFHLVQPLQKRFFPKGIQLFPGEKVVSIRGRAGPFYVPMQVRTIPMIGPHEGVVRRSYTSATPAGSSTPHLPAGTKIAWANFQFEKQPDPSLTLRVDWYRPNGHGLGVAPKANRHVVSSFIRSAQPIPSGRWQAVLRAFDKNGKAYVIKQQFVRIG